MKYINSDRGVINAWLVLAKTPWKQTDRSNERIIRPFYSFPISFTGPKTTFGNWDEVDASRKEKFHFGMIYVY